ncbi:ligase-associated DNA damage response exonuclease [Allohahella marinimesophila]|uniref:Ligase-associated DNA damage response exonuclease n=2 Tax=Allohahella marinimesophila TaxID=1054972 RepID=A0ABP7NRM3_9GAMM
MGHGRYFAHHDSLPILRHRLGDDIDVHGFDYGEPLSVDHALNDAPVVTLHSAGHVLGSAQVRIQNTEGVTVITGDFKIEADPSCAAFELVPCDQLITEATFAMPIYRWPPIESVVADIVAWWRHCAERGKTAVLCAYAFGKAQRILAELLRYAEASGEPLPAPVVLQHGAMEVLTELYRAAGIAMYPTLAAKDAEVVAGQLVLAPPSASGSTWMKRFRKPEVGFCSGWMQVRGNRRRRGYDRGFIISDHADWPQLMQLIDGSGASAVFPTHGNTDILVRYLRERGRACEPLATAFSDEE